MKKLLSLFIFLLCSCYAIAQIKQICGDLPPAGWITIAIQPKCATVGGTNFIGRTIEKIDQLPAGTILNICGDLPPAGWVTLAIQPNCATAGGTNFIGRTIEKIDGLPFGTTLDICGDNPPDGWLTTAIRPNCATVGSTIFIGRTIVKTDFNGAAPGTVLNTCGGLPPAGWITTAIHPNCAAVGSTVFIGRTIEKFDGLPYGSILHVCGDLAPSGWVTTEITPNCATVFSTSYIGRTIQNITLPPNASDLSNLTINAGVLTPAFATDIINYTAEVGNAVATIKVTSTLADPLATILVNGSLASSKVAKSVALQVGVNNIAIRVTAQDKATVKTYVIKVTRATLPNLYVSNIKLSTGVLTPAFTPENLNYTASVANTITSLTLTPFSTLAGTVLTVNNKTVATGKASASIPLIAGQNVITVKSTAPNGTSKSYKVTVARALSSNADLSNIVVNRGTLKPAFSPSITSYQATIGGLPPFHLNLTVTAADVNATIAINGIPVRSGVLSPDITGGAPVIVVTAQNGTVKTYTFSSVGILLTPALAAENEPVDNQGLSVHKGFSPNGDGNNDYLLIDGIVNFPDNKFTVVTLNGAKVFEMTGYNNVSQFFDGHSNITGRLQPAGTYFYKLEYNDKGSQKFKTGYFIIKN